MSAWAISRDELLRLQLVSELGDEVEDLYNLVAELRVQMRFLEIENERLNALWAEGKRVQAHESPAASDYSQPSVV